MSSWHPPLQLKAPQSGSGTEAIIQSIMRQNVPIVPTVAGGGESVSGRLLNFPFPHADPDAFATRGENLDFISAYADFIAPPIRCGVAVTALRCRDGARLDGAGWTTDWRSRAHGAQSVSKSV
jgi:hypothetical protein